MKLLALIYAIFKEQSMHDPTAGLATRVWITHHDLKPVTGS